jgi:hypothetical protein
MLHLLDITILYISKTFSNIKYDWLIVCCLTSNKKYFLNIHDVNYESWKTFNAHIHCRQRAPVGIVLSSSGTSQLGMFDIQATTKNKYYDHMVLLYLESRRWRYQSINFVCFYLYVSVVNLIDYLDIDKMMDINNEKC